MDRKGIIAITVAVITLLVWMPYYSKQTQKIAAAQKAAAEQAARERAAAAPAVLPEAPTPGTEPAPGATGLAAAPAGTPAGEAGLPEQKETVTTPEAAFAFTNHGAGFTEVTLPKHLAEHGLPVQLNHLGSIPIGALSETAGQGTAQPYKMTATPDSGEVLFERTDSRQVKVTKKFTLPKAGAPQPYLSTMEVTFTNTGAQPVAMPSFFVHTGTAAPVHAGDLPTYTGFGWLHGGNFTFKDSASFNSGFFMNRKEQPVFTDQSGEAAWAGTTDQYFTSIITPKGHQGAGVWVHRFTVEKTIIGQVDAPKPDPTKIPEGPAAAVLDGALQMAGFTLEPGKTETFVFELYTGPREYSKLRDLGAGQDAIMNFGKFRVVSKVLLASMNWLHSRFGNYAAAIIVLTILIRGLMWPLQNKANRSMKRMQALQPEMTALKEKYSDDPQRMNQELMKLYKVYQINPVAGCLPMIVQIPVFFGFYSMLGTAVELRNASFLWVHDLSQPDTIGHLFGFPVNVLPLLMAITMLVQMRLSPKSGDPMQQKVFMFMPVVFVGFCYFYASALALYWTVQNIFSIVQLYITRDQKLPALQKIIPPSKRKNR